MPNYSHTNHTTTHHDTTQNSTQHQHVQDAHGQYHMQQFNQEYDQYRHFLVNKGPRNPCSAPQAVMSSLDKHLTVLQSMENKDPTQAPRRPSA